MQGSLACPQKLDHKMLSTFAHHPSRVMAIHSHMHCAGLPCLLVMGKGAHARGWREAEGRGRQAANFQATCTWRALTQAELYAMLKEIACYAWLWKLNKAHTMPVVDLCPDCLWPIPMHNHRLVLRHITRLRAANRGLTILAPNLELSCCSSSRCYGALTAPHQLIGSAPGLQALGL